MRDLQAARNFYGSLGFGFHDHFSDDRTAAVIVDDTIAVMLHTDERFAELVSGEMATLPAPATVVHSLMVGSREEVDDLVSTARAAGGRPGRPAEGDDSRYTAGFADPDGHLWELVSMEPVHVID